MENEDKDDDKTESEAEALTAIINRIITFKGELHCIWMNMDQIPTALKYYDAIAVYSQYIKEDVS